MKIKKIFFLMLLIAITLLFNTCSDIIWHSLIIESAITEYSDHSGYGYYDRVWLDYSGYWEFKVRYYDGIKINIEYCSALSGKENYFDFEIIQDNGVDYYVTKKRYFLQSSQLRITVDKSDVSKWVSNSRVANYKIIGLVK